MVDYEYGTFGVPHTGVLQPLTSVMATLTLLRSDVTLNVEKILAFSDEVLSSGVDGDIKNVGLKGFISKSIKHLCPSGTSGIGSDDGE